MLFSKNPQLYATTVSNPNLEAFNLSPTNAGSTTGAAAHQKAAAASYAAVEAEIFGKLDELEDKLAVVTQSDERKGMQINKIINDQGAHCHNVAQVYQSISQLIQKTDSISDAHRTVEEKLTKKMQNELLSLRDSLTQQQTKRADETNQQVRRVLENFKDELVSSVRDTNTKLVTVQSSLEKLHERVARSEEALTSCRETIQEHSASLRHLNEDNVRVLEKTVAQLEVRFATLERTCDDLRGRLDHVAHGDLLKTSDAVRELRVSNASHDSDLQSMRATLDTVTSQSQRFALDLDSLKELLHDRFESQQKELSQQLTQSQNHIASIQHEVREIGNLEKEFRTLQSSLRDITTKQSSEHSALSEKVESVLHTTVDLLRQSETMTKSSVSESVRKVEADVERRHRRLIETTQQAITDASKQNDTTPALLATLQEEMRFVRDTLHAHSVAIDAHRMEGNLDSAFTELKDWLQDVERRMMSRTEIEDALTNLSSQFQALKHNALSSDALLGQRLDAERAAREHDISHHSTQLQRLQTAMKR